MRSILVAAILAGVLLRCDGLGRRPLWYDEAATVMHLSGRTEADIRSWYDGRPFQSAALGLDGGSSAPSRDRPTLAAVVRTVAIDEPHHGPGYFACAFGWTRLAGEDLVAIRSLSALASVLTLPLVYRLARRAFHEHDVGLLAAALVSLSPLHIRYAAEARPYALWSLALVALALAVVRARERRSRMAWTLYAAALASALAIHPLTVLAMPAMAAFALQPTTGTRDRRFWLASAAVLPAWIVWAAAAWFGRATIDRAAAWEAEPIGLLALFRGWFGVATSVFYRPGGDGGLIGGSSWSRGDTLLWSALGLAALSLAGNALVALRRCPDIGTRRGVRRLGILPWATLAGIDLVVGGRRSTVDRYLVPSWIGLELAVARWLAPPRRQLVLTTVLVLGAATAIKTRPLGWWWNTDAPRLRTLAIAAAEVNATPDAVVVTDMPPLALVELAHQLSPAVTFRVGAEAPDALTATEWDRVLFVAPSARLLERARRAAGPERTLRLAGTGGVLWRVERSRPSDVRQDAGGLTLSRAAHPGMSVAE